MLFKDFLRNPPENTYCRDGELMALNAAFYNPSHKNTTREKKITTREAIRDYTPGAPPSQTNLVALTTPLLSPRPSRAISGPQTYAPSIREEHNWEPTSFLRSLVLLKSLPKGFSL